MKKALLVLACMLLFSGSVTGCSDGGWPKQVTQGDWTVTKLEEEPEPDTRQIQYENFSVKRVVGTADVIIKTTITDPVYYGIDDGSSLNSPYLAYEVVDKKVYYTDSNIKEGDTIRFFRCYHVDQVWVTLQPGNTYVLFLERGGADADSDIALTKVAEYISIGPDKSILDYATISDDYIEELVSKYKKPQEGTP